VGSASDSETPGTVSKLGRGREMLGTDDPRTNPRWLPRAISAPVETSVPVSCGGCACPGCGPACSAAISSAHREGKSARGSGSELGL
jgi:hypothetical protein